ncbi:HoxN/HupN/NixA family nickel/cobalt transporter [Pullulanibacillus sp. KACC 23026]|uniref:HoxN/HupN/NixA family nickel/cobalt transporter n=1 Tax=Pullulanibacillus sp. KACC 23026 TaxID=3028315 RepID=UPI0023B1DB91|nr:HoxN/HupN/NixA family nickel/cobalt transporter [Pullulanibacillus sp. KACC 23026]WEG11415.1 HoxN/HupN/NixA family nickel/cobalt transporter [Pullulanibacillus sp. KACC 23026]
MAQSKRGFKGGIPYLVIVGILHVLGIGLLLLGGATPFLIGMAVIAYMLGLRHAFDVDHIAAIDNTVRKLLQQGSRPSGVGFYFSIGHSTVVFIMAVLTSISVRWAQQETPRFQEIGGLIGTIVSGCFLILIAFLNLIILKDMGKAFLNMNRGSYDHEKVERLLLSRGLMGRFFSPLFKLVNRSWHVYPIGFLFGLGFDTASEVALLSIAVAASQQAVPVLGMMALPILFAAGMSLMDTLDALFMERAYQWAFTTPLRKVYYNLTLTSISVLAALVIGVIEVGQVISQKLHLTSGIGGWFNRLSFGYLGFWLVGFFLISWLVSIVIWRNLKVEKAWQETEL